MTEKPKRRPAGTPPLPGDTRMAEQYEELILEVEELEELL